MSDDVLGTLLLLAGLVAAIAGVIALSEAIARRPRKPQAFVDLAGKVPAKPGDRVALLRNGVHAFGRSCDLVQVDEDRRPILAADGSVRFDHDLQQLEQTRPMPLRAPCRYAHPAGTTCPACDPNTRKPAGAR